MFGSRTAKLAQLPALTLVLLLLLPGFALADNIAPSEGDEATVITGNTLDFGAVCVGTSKVATIGLAAVRNGKYPGPQVYANGAAVTFTRTALSGAGVSGPANPVGSVVLSGDWDDAGNNALSDAALTTLTYTPTTTGSLSGSVTYSGAGTGSNSGTVTRTTSLNLSGSAANCDSTPPVIVPDVSGTFGSNGWYVSNVTVSWSVTDAQSAISSSSGCGTTVLGADTAGITYTCTATSAGGTASNSVTVKRDATAPTGVNVSADRAPDSNGWYTAPFTATWWGSDATSGIDSCTQTAYSGPDDASGSLSGTCTDEAGNVSGSLAFAFKYDATGPTVVGTPDRAPDSNGWYNHPVAITWSVSGDTSGEGTCDAPTVYSGPSSSAVTVGGNCTDGAGNSGSGVFGAFKYDAVAPSADIAADRGVDANGWYNHAFIATTTGSDDASGIASCTGPQTYSGPDTAGGSLTGTCTDEAGNTSSVASLAFKFDGTKPTAEIAADRAPDSNGWYNHALTATTTGSDGLSGIGSCTAPQPYAGPDGSNLSLQGSCTDNAGNTSLTASLLFNYDGTAPIIALVSRTAANGNNWNAGNVALEWSCTDVTSGALASSIQETVSTEGAGQEITATCEDVAGNSASDTQSDLNIDKTPPGISYVGATPAPNGNGWNNTDVVMTWSCSDSLSGVVAATDVHTVSAEGTNLGATGTCEDRAGHTTSDSRAGISIDKTAPTNIQWTGGPADGASYYFGSVPPVPSGCSASDALSGVVSCSITGYSAAVGSHTMTATATDAAGNTDTDTRSYTVLAWTLKGFYQPVDIGVWNTVKNGSTVPLKWEVFAGSTELTDTSIISTLQKQITCGTTLPEDTVEVTATGGTSLRYDTTAGQFIFNWQTPKRSNTCWAVTMVTADGSSIQALFKLK